MHASPQCPYTKSCHKTHHLVIPYAMFGIYCSPHRKVPNVPISTQMAFSCGVRTSQGHLMCRLGHKKCTSTQLTSPLSWAFLHSCTFASLLLLIGRGIFPFSLCSIFTAKTLQYLISPATWVSPHIFFWFYPLFEGQHPFSLRHNLFLKLLRGWQSCLFFIQLHAIRQRAAVLYTE